MIPDDARARAEAFITNYVSERHRGTGSPPGIRSICRGLEDGLKLKRVVAPDITGPRGLYPGGIRSIYEAARVPERLIVERTARTRKASDARLRAAAERRGGGKAPEAGREASRPQGFAADDALRSLTRQREKEEGLLKLEEAKLSEERRIKEARRATLALKANREPGTIALYLQQSDPQRFRRYTAYSERDRKTLEDVCTQLSEESQPFDGAKDFDEQLDPFFERWERSSKVREIREIHSRLHRMRCKCNTVYEYSQEQREDIDLNKTYTYSRFICPLPGHGSRVEECPICKSVDGFTVYLRYDAGKGALTCPRCGESWTVGDPLRPVGTYLSEGKPLSVAEQRRAAVFIRRWQKQPGGARAALPRVERYIRDEDKLEKLTAERRETLQALRQEVAGERARRDALRRSNEELTKEIQWLTGTKANLERETAELKAGIPPLETEYLQNVEAVHRKQHENVKQKWGEKTERVIEEALRRVDETEQMLRQRLEKIEAEAEDVAKKATDKIRGLREEIDGLEGDRQRLQEENKRLEEERARLQKEVKSPTR